MGFYGLFRFIRSSFCRPQLTRGYRFNYFIFIAFTCHSKDIAGKGTNLNGSLVVIDSVASYSYSFVNLTQSFLGFSFAAIVRNLMDGINSFPQQKWSSC
jgi:hypothetical protein